MNHETALIRAFVVPYRRGRYTELLLSSKGREKFRRYLAHFHDLDERYTYPLPTSEDTVAGLYQHLQKLGAPEFCHIISENDTIDGKILSLHDAIGKVLGKGQGAFLSCIAGKVAYYEGEEPKMRLICKRSDDVYSS